LKGYFSVQDPDKPPRQISIPSLIGWLSLCMLAATWGRTIDTRWQALWAKAGTVGLIAAVILERTEKAKHRRKSKIRKEAAQAVSENRLARLNDSETTHSSVIEAIHELATFAGSELSQYPLKVLPVVEDDEAYEIDWTKAIRGELISISAKRIYFSHIEAFGKRIVLLQFKLHRRKTICFVVEIVGTQSTGTGYTSTGAVLATGVPENPSAEPDSAEQLQTV
jgi:hypothetical protein